MLLELIRGFIKPLLNEFLLVLPVFFFVEWAPDSTQSKTCALTLVFWILLIGSCSLAVSRRGVRRMTTGGPSVHDGQVGRLATGVQETTNEFDNPS